MAVPQSPHLQGGASRPARDGQWEGQHKTRESTARSAVRRRPPARPARTHGRLPAGLSSAWPQPRQQPVRTRSSRRGWHPVFLRLAVGVGEGGWPPWVEVGQGVGAGVGARYMRGGRWLQMRGAPVGGWVLEGKGGA